MYIKGRQVQEIQIEVDNKEIIKSLFIKLLNKKFEEGYYYNSEKEAICYKTFSFMDDGFVERVVSTDKTDINNFLLLQELEKALEERDNKSNEK